MAIVGYWRLNGNSNDASGNSNNGTDTDVTYSNANGKLNKGAGFNGSSSFTSLTGSKMNTYATGSLSVWFKLSTSGSINTIISVNNADLSKYTVLYIGGSVTSELSDESICFGCKESDADGKLLLMAVRKGTDYFNDGKWHNVVIIVDGINGRILVDSVNYGTSYYGGTLDGTQRYFFNITVPTSAAIGKRTYAVSPLFYNGSVDEIILDSVPWTEAKAKNEYSRVKGFF